MEGELKNLLKVSIIVAILMTYARYAAARTPPGLPRLAALLPVILLLPLLPFSFSSLHLRGISGFFLAWLALFKLLLLSFSVGPLHPSLSLPVFVSTASLPVKLRSSSSPTPSPLFLPTLLKAFLLFLLLSLYNYKHSFHSYFLIVVYCCHIYLSLELVLAGARFLAGAVLGLDIEPQFNAPYCSTSLRDFWGRRWNLMVPGILRPAVFIPVHARLGTAASVLATFLISGLMHEAMFFYLSVGAPTGEVTGFFVLHGLCAAAEGAIARRLRGKWGGVHPVIAAPMVMGFVGATGFWLFFPPLLRSGADERVLEECAAVVAFLEETRRALADQIGIVLSRS